MQSRRGRRPPASPFVPIRKPKDINTIDNVLELQEILRRTEEELTRCSQTLRGTLLAKKARVQSRLEIVSSMGKVTNDLRETHISSPLVTPSDDIQDVSMDDAVIVSSPTSPHPHRASFSSEAGPSGEGSHHTTMSTKAKILATPISPRTERARPQGSSGIRMLDHETSIRIQQEDISRRMEAQRLRQEAASHRERKIIEQTDQAAAAAMAESSSMTAESPELYREDLERRARILAFMNYRPDSDNELEEDDDSDGELDDEAMEAMLEEEYEDGTKGQHIVDPDGLEDLIRVDPDHLFRNDSTMSMGMDRG